MSTSSNNHKFFAGDNFINNKAQGNRLARRARSFKEDFLEIISQMRSSGSSVPHSASPFQKSQMKPNDFPEKNLNKNSVQDLDCNSKQVFLALKHFQDVINKNKLEMLPGNGTIVLDTVTAIHILLKQYGLNEQSSTLVSATNQVYQSVAQLVKLCDDYLLMGKKAFEKENVKEIVNSVEFAVQNLVSLVKDKINIKDCSQKILVNVPPVCVKYKPKMLSGINDFDFNQRSSLPDIPLTPREREILEKTSTFALERHFQSTENILEDSPPPKPPHPDRVNVNSFPPPLPPKTRQKNVNALKTVKNSMEYLSLRSKSLENSPSQLSTSTESVDSFLNYCKEKHETDLVDYHCNDKHTESNDIDKNYCQIKSEESFCTENLVWEHSLSSEENLQANINSTKKISTKILESPYNTENFSYKGMSDLESSVESMLNSKSLCQSFLTSNYLNSSSLSQQSYTNQESYHTEKEIISTMESISSQKFKFINICHKNISSKTFKEQDSYQNQPNACFSCEAFNNDSKNSGHSNKMEHKLMESDVSENVIKRTYCNSKNNIFSTDIVLPLEGKPPPLPPKKKHMFQSVAFSVMAYMEMFGNASHPNTSEFLRHSVHAYNLLQSEWQKHQTLLNSAQSCSFSTNCGSYQKISRLANGLNLETKSLPPALPPKKKTRSNTNSPPLTPVAADNIIKRSEEKKNQIQEISSNGKYVTSNITSTSPVSSSENSVRTNDSFTEIIKIKDNEEVFLLDKLYVSDYLVFKKEEDEGPDLRGGHPDALVIHATKAQKNDFIYQEAFLTTYRTFLSPLELIQKLCYRYEKFSNSQDPSKQRAARESFSLLVRVVSDLTLTDLEQIILQTLMEFVQQLLCRGDLTMAKALRIIMLNKYEAKKLYVNVSVLLPSHNISTRQFLLLDFKSEQIAEQMTLLDAELFSKIEIPEVLIWAQEQNEERSPNLTKFTEHFNKMSYWARSKILEQKDAKDREKYVIKFIKVMKHLRKINNFNSYLALLSALDSAPIRRLEWQKNITEGLKEYCALIDSSSSFRAYRLALAETHPPCIPYLGLVLQDLTFVHIGNTNTLPTGEVNFSKRWQQFNIVENMKRFKKVSYQYKKNDKIIVFFNGFDDSLSEEAMWQISEKIKPRGGKKA